MRVTPKAVMMSQKDRTVQILQTLVESNNHAVRAKPSRLRLVCCSSSSSLAAAAASNALPSAAARGKMVLQNDIDLLNPPADLEKLKHKKKRLVQSPNSFFMDVKCQGCFSITTVFSHSQTVVVCPGCQTVLCQPTGGKARLTEGCSFRRKGD
ncbi:unnamed protein product [Miscanthus lutarioriparius]|uniref:40S ribosomal protein S27 n=2 Tax=Miscanthus TaxID=62336 RepID=A0A811Q6A2_9POAL|nr:unnamed protein product [Miscanthus lutarioriparius]